MRRFHLLSFMAALLTASVLVGANALLFTQTIESYTPLLNKDDFVLSADRAYGWPLTAIHHNGYVIPTVVFERRCDDPGYAKLKREMDSNPRKATQLGGQTFTRIPEGVLTLFLVEWNAWAIILNVTILLACSTLALFACESFLRRRESHADASRRLSA